MQFQEEAHRKNLKAGNGKTQTLKRRTKNKAALERYWLADSSMTVSKYMMTLIFQAFKNDRNNLSYISVNTVLQKYGIQGKLPLHLKPEWEHKI
jgi:hypothetical protein